MYIKMGFMRLQPDIQVELIPLLFQCVSNRSTAHQETLFGLVVHALQHLKIIPNMNENVIKYGLSDQPAIRHLFLNFLLNVILLPYKFVQIHFSSPLTNGDYFQIWRNQSSQSDNTILCRALSSTGWRSSFFHHGGRAKQGGRSIQTAISMYERTIV